MIYYNPINALNNKTEVNHFTFDWSIMNKTFSFIHLDFFYILFGRLLFGYKKAG